VQGKDRLVVTYIAQQLDLEGSYVPRTYIEQIQLEKLVMAMPDDLKTKLNLNEDLGAITQLSEQISSLHDRMDEFTNRIEELNTKLTIKEKSPSQQNMDLQAESYDGSVPTSCLITSLSNGSLNGSIMSNPSLPSQLAKESPLRNEDTAVCPTLGHA
ncbi:uridine-cytidine kinase C-like protein, partial [Trifolium pratense]